jgi:outer membrane receptor protein involved in Fe transport
MLLWSAAVASLAAGLGMAAPAAAQDAGMNEEETIVVTARKREETLQEAPVAVTAIGQEQIQDLQINSIDDIARFAPGLSFSKTFGRSTDRPVIRGQSNVLANVQFGVESGTAYFVDGVYFPSSIQSFDLGDVSRVEIIKGPQSALYGRNTYAGAINFITRDPRETAFNASFVAAEHGERDWRYSMEGPLSDTLSGRFSIRRYDYDGEYTNTVTGRLVGDESTFSMAGLLLWEPTNNLSVRVRGSYTLDDDGPIPIFFQSAAANNCMPGWRSLAAWTYSGSTNRNQYYCGVIQPGQVALSTDAVTVLPAPVPGVPVGNSNPFPPPFGPSFPVYSTADGTAFDGIERETVLLSAITSWDIGGSGYTIDFDTGVRVEEEKFGADSDHSAVNHIRGVAGVDEAFFANTTRDEINDYSMELRFSTPSDRRLRGTLGGYYFHAENDGFDITFADPEGRFNFTDTSTTTNQAIFAMLEADLTDSLTVTLEGRYAEEEKERTEFNPVTTAITYGPRTVSFDSFTPRLTIDWNPAPDWTVYAIYAEGNKPGGLNGSGGITVSRPEYEPEESENVEIGLKGSLFDGRFQFSTALYHIEATNVQLTTPIIAVGAQTSIVTNQGDGETWGAEIEARWEITDNLSISGGYAWTTPEFTSGCDEDQWTLTSGGGRLQAGNSTAPGTGTSFDPITGVQLAYGSLGNCSIVGNRYPMSAEHQANFVVDWRNPLSGGMEFFANANATYESSKFVQVDNFAETGETLLLGARMGVESEHWSLAAFGRNLTDEDTITLATRWLTNPYATFNGFTNVAPSTSPGAPAPGPFGAQRSAPRGFFGGLRPGSTVGVELRLRY